MLVIIELALLVNMSMLMAVPRLAWIVVLMLSTLVVLIVRLLVLLLPMMVTWVRVALDIIIEPVKLCVRLVPGVARAVFVLLVMPAIFVQQELVILRRR